MRRGARPARRACAAAGGRAARPRRASSCRSTRRASSSTIQSTLAYILVNRDGPRLQPGPRNYARSWIRDGALTSSALLEMGFTQEVREFLDWFAPYQTAGRQGAVLRRPPRRRPGARARQPRRVRLRGRRVLPLHARRRLSRPRCGRTSCAPSTTSTRCGASARPTSSGRRDKQAFFGLLAGLDQPRGLLRAAGALVLGRLLRAARLEGRRRRSPSSSATTSTPALRQAPRRLSAPTLYASIARTMADHEHRLHPRLGRARRLRSDARRRSRSIPGASSANLPRAGARPHVRRVLGGIPQAASTITESWDAYTPYEVRNVGTLVRLGRTRRGAAGPRLHDRRPAADRLERVGGGRSGATPRGANFIGDMPHTWVGSSFIRSVRALFAYEREHDQALVLAAGIPARVGHATAARRGAPSADVLRRGELQLESVAPDLVRVQLSGDLRLPPGNLVLRPPLERPLQAVRVNGKPIETFSADEAVVSELPATVELDSSAPPPTPTPAPTHTPAAPKRPGKKTKPPRAATSEGTGRCGRARGLRQPRRRLSAPTRLRAPVRSRRRDEARGGRTRFRPLAPWRARRQRASARSSRTPSDGWASAARMAASVS